jgi:hypothetical protein
MLHYCLNTGRTFETHRDELDETKFYFASTQLHDCVHFLAEDRLKLEIKILGDIALAAKVWVRHRGEYFPAEEFWVAPTDFAANILWELIESFYLKIGDLPLFRAKDYAAPMSVHRV